MIQLASLGGGVRSQLAPHGDRYGPLPSEVMRCGGPVVVVGVRDGNLWLADARGQPFIISLQHPGLKARCLAAAGDLGRAVVIAHNGACFGLRGNSSLSSRDQGL